MSLLGRPHACLRRGTEHSGHGRGVPANSEQWLWRTTGGTLEGHTEGHSLFLKAPRAMLARPESVDFGFCYNTVFVPQEGQLEPSPMSHVLCSEQNG